MKQPDYSDYLRVYNWHGLNDRNILTDTVSEKSIRNCFDQISELSRHHSVFNEILPPEFIKPLRAYHDGDDSVHIHFQSLENQTLFLSDFMDYIILFRKKNPS